MIYLISNRVYPTFTYVQRCEFKHVMEWIKSVPGYELDIETNLEEDLTLKEIFTVQFGSLDGQYQFFIDIGGITPEQLEELKEVLQDDSKMKLGFNLTFEYSVIKMFWGVEIDNLFDISMLLKIVLNGKYMEGYVFSLAGAVKEYLGIEMDKTLQTSFTAMPYSESQIIYGATDVMYCAALASVIYSWEFEEPVYEWDNEALAWYTVYNRQVNIVAEMDKYIKLRMRAIPVLGDILCEGWYFDKESWGKNIVWAQGEADKSYEDMCNFIRTEMREDAILYGFLTDKDTLNINWGSTTQKTEILQLIYPELVNTKAPALKVFAKTLPDDNYIDYIIDKQFAALNNRLITEQLDKIKAFSGFIPAETVTINFDSPKQRLALFQIKHPGIQDTKEETLEDLESSLMDAYKLYIKKTKLASSYGENWYKAICSDGKIRARSMDPLLVTGRISLSKPGIMTVPADGGYYLGDRYRSAFLPPEGWVVSAVDFASQELLIIAELSQEPIWLEAIKDGKDIHSISAYKVFGQKWIDSGGDSEGVVKPKSKEGKEMRDSAKTISFGLAYGAGPKKVAKKTNTSIREATQMMKNYFEAFPFIKMYFDKVAKLGQIQGWVATRPPYNFRRNFPKWNEYYVDRSDLSAIGREAKNLGIQGEGSEQSFEAMILIRNYIREHKLQDRVRFVMPLHDATVCIAREDYAEEWGPIHVSLMEQGAAMTMSSVKIPGDLTLTKTWTK